VNVQVPEAAEIDVSTQLGDVMVGATYDKRSRLTYIPTSVRRIKARTSGIANYISVELAKHQEPNEQQGAPPTIVDVECEDGWIRVAAEDAIVNARVAGSAGGPVRFDGSLASGDHSFVSDGPIRAFLPEAASYEFDAKAPNGFIVNEFYPQERSRFANAMCGKIGMHPNSRLVLRSSRQITLGKLGGRLAREH
jgi:hypothetical protein